MAIFLFVLTIGGTDYVLDHDLSAEDCAASLSELIQYMTMPMACVPQEQ